jgi:hypothetical protein
MNTSRELKPLSEHKVTSSSTSSRKKNEVTTRRKPLIHSKDPKTDKVKVNSV